MPGTMTGRPNAAHSREKFWLTLERPDVFPRGHCGLNALSKPFARWSEIHRFDARVRPEFQFRGGHDNLCVWKHLRVGFMVHEAIDVVAVKMGEKDRLDCLGVEPRCHHALRQLPVPRTIDRMSAGAGVDQRQAITGFDGPGREHELRMGVREASSAQRGLDLLDSGVLDHAVAQRNLARSVNQAEDFNVADLVFSERLRALLLSVGRADNGDAFVESECRISTGCAEQEIAARDFEHLGTPLTDARAYRMGGYRTTSALGGGLNRSAQHSNLLAEMECGHEAATSHLLFCGSAA